MLVQMHQVFLRNAAATYDLCCLLEILIRMLICLRMVFYIASLFPSSDSLSFSSLDSVALLSYSDSIIQNVD